MALLALWKSCDIVPPSSARWPTVTSSVLLMALLHARAVLYSSSSERTRLSQSISWCQGFDIAVFGKARWNCCSHYIGPEDAICETRLLYIGFLSQQTWPQKVLFNYSQQVCFPKVCAGRKRLSYIVVTYGNALWFTVFVEIANFPIYLFFLIMNGVKLSQRRFRPDIRENFFTVRVVKHEQASYWGGGCPIPGSTQEAFGWCPQ